MNSEDLTGTLVLVHPEMKDDPIQKQGQPGMLLYVNAEKDDIYVAFGNGVQGLYPSNGLLVFKKPADLYRELLTGTRDLNIPDFKALMRINMLLDNGTSQDAKDAMQLVTENPGIIPKAMVTLQEHLGLEVNPDLEQQHALPVSRTR